MKIMITTLVLAVVAASPALAESKSHNKRVQTPQRSQSYDRQSDRRPHSSNPQWDVYRNDGTYAGSDPDPHVRMNLFRDDPLADE